MRNYSLADFIVSHGSRKPACWKEVDAYQGGPGSFKNALASLPLVAAESTFADLPAATPLAESGYCAKAQVKGSWFLIYTGGYNYPRYILQVPSDWMGGL